MALHACTDSLDVTGLLTVPTVGAVEAEELDEWACSWLTTTAMMTPATAPTANKSSNTLARTCVVEWT